MPQKILWVLSSFAVGAAQRRLAALINGVGEGGERGCEHVLLAIDDDYAATRLLGSETRWRRLNPGGATKREFGGGGFLISKLWSSRRVLAQERPDLVVTAGLGATEWLAVNRGGSAAPHLHFQDPVGPEEAVEGADGRGDWGRRRAFPGQRRLFIAGDAETAGLLSDRWGAPKSAVRDLPWGVDLDIVRPQRSKTNAGGVVFGSLSPLVAEKRHDRLLRILASLVERGRNASVRLVGEGPDRRRLETAAQSMEIEDRVIFVERDGLDPRVAMEETAQMDVYVDLADVSRIPAAAVLAMAAGLPMLANRDGAAARIAPCANGLFLRPVRDESALTAAAELLAADPDLREGVGAANRAAAEERFGRDAMVKAFKDLISELSAPGRLALPAPQKTEAEATDRVPALSRLSGAATRGSAEERKRDGERGRSASA